MSYATPEDGYAVGAVTLEQLDAMEEAGEKRLSAPKPDLCSEVVGDPYHITAYSRTIWHMLRGQAFFQVTRFYPRQHLALDCLPAMVTEEQENAELERRRSCVESDGVTAYVGYVCGDEFGERDLREAIEAARGRVQPLPVAA